jgi:hypothetical protein
LAVHNDVALLRYDFLNILFLTARISLLQISLYLRFDNEHNII